MYLAIGFNNDFDWSVHVNEEATPIEIAGALDTGCCGDLWPEQILMIKNGPEGPEVFNRYFAGRHYDTLK